MDIEFIIYFVHPIGGEGRPKGLDGGNLSQIEV